MTWRNAFIEQARHDYAVYRMLNQQGAVVSDQLHYIQMSSEKLSRGYLADSTDPNPLEMTHAGVVRMLQLLKADRLLRRKLGYASSCSFTLYIDPLLDVAGRIQALAPAIAGTTQPNPEYPWLDRGANEIRVPCRHNFDDMNRAHNPEFEKFLKLLGKLVTVIN
jgi:hypothetical protein